MTRLLLLQRQQYAWPTWIHGPLVAAFGPEAASRINVVNAGVPGVTSAWFAACHRVRVPSDTDVVFLEFAVNDEPAPDLDRPARRVHERLVRKLLKYPNRPAVVTYNHYQAS